MPVFKTKIKSAVNKVIPVIMLLAFLPAGFLLSGCDQGELPGSGDSGSPEGSEDSGSPAGEGSAVQPIGNLSVGDRVMDKSWKWEFRTLGNYEGDVPGKPVTWIVVAKDHYSGIGSHVTLISEDLIAHYAFDDSTSRVSEFGSNDWGTSGDPDAEHGVRTFLNGTFYNAMSDSFKSAIITTTLPNLGYETTDNVFLPSSTELGEAENDETEPVGTAWGYFTDDASRVALFQGRPDWYWTRSPVTRGWRMSNVRLVHLAGYFANSAANYSLVSVRPALNLSSETQVSERPNEDGVYLVINK